MRSILVGNLVAIFLFLTAVLPSIGEEPAESNDYHVLVKQGNEALARNELRAAAQVFQRAVDINASSAKAFSTTIAPPLQALSTARSFAGYPGTICH
jgi:hypothetical protein